jgi:predicted transcriptional regulator
MKTPSQTPKLPPEAEEGNAQHDATHNSGFIAAIQEGLSDVDAGRVISEEELNRQLDAEFGPLKMPTKPSR